MKNVMALNTSTFVDMERKEKDVVLWNVRRVLSLLNPSGTIKYPHLTCPTLRL